jgi:hypothetical protein
VTETGKKQRARTVCDRDIVRLQKKRGRDIDGLTGLNALKLQCDTDGKWKRACDDVPSNDGSIEVRMESFADVETVQSANVEMPCKALTRDKGVRFTYKWTTVEGGRTKPIPEVRSPLDAVNDKFVYQKYPNTSVLVINGVKESDLNMYTCIAIFNGKEHPESFKLEKKDCSPLNIPDYGKFLEGDVRLPQRPGTRLTPKCDEGYTNIPGSTKHLTCNLWGKWVDETESETDYSEWEQKRFHVCQTACMKEPINSNVLEEIIVSKDLGSRGQVPMTIPAGSTLTYRCKDNYKLSGEKSRVCHKNGTFSSKIPTCKHKCLSKCNVFSLPNIEFSYKTAQFPGTKRKTCSLHMKCPKAYKPNGIDTLYCDTKRKLWVDDRGNSFKYSDRPSCRE